MDKFGSLPQFMSQRKLVAGQVYQVAEINTNEKNDNKEVDDNPDNEHDVTEDDVPQFDASSTDDFDFERNDDTEELSIEYDQRPTYLIRVTSRLGRAVCLSGKFLLLKYSYFLV